MPRRIDLDSEIQQAEANMVDAPDAWHTIMLRFRPVQYLKLLQGTKNYNEQSGNDMPISLYAFKCVMDTLESGGLKLSPDEQEGLQTLMNFWKSDAQTTIKRLLNRLHTTDLADAIIESEIATKADRASKTKHYHQN